MWTSLVPKSINLNEITNKRANEAINDFHVPVIFTTALANLRSVSE